MTTNRSFPARFSLLTLGLLAAPAASHAQYNVFDLGVLSVSTGSQASRAYAINNNNFITGYVFSNVTLGSGTTTAGQQAFLIDGNKTNPSVTNAGALLGTTGGSGSTGFSLNNSNVVVGSSSQVSGGPQRAAYYDGTLHDAGTVGLLRGVNNSGLAVGASGPTQGTAVTYQTTGAGAGTLTSIVPGLGNPVYSVANAINNSGLIAGYSGASNASNGAFLYDPGTNSVKNLGTLGGAKSSGDGFLGNYGLNNAGHLVGYSAINAAGTLHAFYYNGSGGLQDLGTLGGTLSGAYSINSSDDIVGYANVVTVAGQPTQHAFLSHAGGSLIDLNTQIAGTNPFSNLTVALSINDNGWVVGEGLVGGIKHGYLLKPITSSVPEPGSVALLVGMGVSGAAVLRRRRK